MTAGRFMCGRAGCYWRVCRSACRLTKSGSSSPREHQSDEECVASFMHVWRAPQGGGLSVGRDLRILLLLFTRRQRRESCCCGGVVVTCVRSDARRWKYTRRWRRRWRILYLWRARRGTVYVAVDDVRYVIVVAVFHCVVVVRVENRRNDYNNRIINVCCRFVLQWSGGGSR